ncbi:MAG: RNA polymerase subunit sigma-70 [Flavobacteriales bacterium CG03_land_8_20_14_0_80_35_15]|nr:MAG: RNA polymerase subunit sigma-70 [Flavobacteriaceae bacterium CG1_02_35_72]PIV18102.1 MAG: RNA polymerase subunit sigma-70 [Flavobacteriales bacterium CG03_land_8_20_14_0_80_35_15]PIX07832.1 MAG: RNA polymerase subunit sigma-70 [Flavobacteriales bacterium CG_4_8_14_3_um_filter_35_10]PJA05396.1 MAG: RNA polymerase subunit sigma-70 [Flavobacteriales bacterium CG_4_10_14_0_2_um_filter_35_18]
MHQEAFLQLVMPFKNKVYRLAKRMLISNDEAEDATQELYLKLWNQKEKLIQYQNVEAYAMTMIKNYCLDQLKSKRADNLTLVYSNYTASDASLEKTIELQDSIDKVHQIIEGLTAQQKLMIQLRDIEQYEFEEIAEITGVKEAAVRVALSRARQIVREQLIKKHQYGIK